MDFANQPVGYRYAIEWECPFSAQITNITLDLACDSDGSRSVSALNLYAFNGASFQTIYSNTNVEQYTNFHLTIGAPSAPCRPIFS
jgi:hypothetical protein